jgi:hypothetical protein
MSSDSEASRARTPSDHQSRHTSAPLNSKASYPDLSLSPQSSQCSRAIARPETENDESPPEDDYAAYKERLIKTMQANFIRFRSPGPKRLTELVQKTLPEVENWDTKLGYMLRNSALKAFDNMRADFMSCTREMAEKINTQLVM